MAEFCAIYPKVGEEDSILYKELYKATGRNRPLTNLVYAMSLLPEFKLGLTSSDFNSQREVNTSIVMEKLNVAEMIDTATTIRNAEQELNATNGTDYIEYDSVDLIYLRVIDFNNRENQKVVASIVSKNNKYIIQIAPIDATTYNKNASLEAGLQLLDYILTKLAEAGLNTTNLSNESKKALNQLNASFGDDLIRRYQAIYGLRNPSDATISLLLDLFRDNAIVSRFRNTLGNDVYEGFRYLLSKSAGEDVEIPLELISYESYLTMPDTLNKFKALKRTIKNKFDSISAGEVKALLTSIYQGNLTEELKSIRETLKDLYEKWHLDLDSITLLNIQLNNLEEITTAMISRAKNSLKILQARGAISLEEIDNKLVEILNIENLLRLKEYASSIIQYLQETLDTLNSIQGLNTDFVQGESGEQDIQELNLIASMLLSVKEQIDSRIPIILALIDMDNIEADELTDSDKQQIKQLASNLNILISSLQRQYRLKQFDLVYNFLKSHWGEESKEFGSFEIALKDALEKGTINMNLFDRGILAMTEVSDPVLATFGLTIKSMHEIRDTLLRDIEYNIRVATEKLYNSGSDSFFMYEEYIDDKGNKHIRLASEIDWNKYYQARKEYYQSLKDQGMSVSRIHTKMIEWDANNLGEYKVKGAKYIEGIIPDIDTEADIILYNVPNENYRKSMPTMTQAQKDYYNYMIGLKKTLELLMERHGVRTNLFMPVLITKELIEEGPDAVKRIKDNFVDLFKIREDDTLFGSLETLIDAEGNEIRHLPVFYIHTLKDLSRLSKDFSKSIMAFASMAINHNTLSQRVSILELTKEFLMERPIELSRGDRALVQTAEVLGKRIVSPVVKKSKETIIGGWLDDIMEAKVYGKKLLKGGTVNIPLVGDISKTKLTNLATQYTSITGLTMNLPGAIANALVGKIQMVIEAGGGEFFGMKDMAKAEKDYWALLPALLGEMYSNNKNSKLALLIDRFDAQDEFYLRLKESGFYKSPLSKILGNTNLFFMYGMGEHLLHAQGMLAVLNHTRVKKKGDSSNKTYSLLEALTVQSEGNNGKLIVDNSFETLDGHEITETFLDRQRKIVQYVNRSMHGAFGDDEKGAIHRYAIGRLVMNFRQWMPAHYARRFNKLHYDALLGDFREGYYVTTYKFVRDLCKDIKAHEFDIMTRWNLLKPMEKANLRRTLTEAILFGLFVALASLDFGKDPKRRTWALAQIRYLIMRINLEIGASTPLNPKSFITNIYKMINEPAAALALVNKLTTIFGIDDLILMKEVLSGPHEGELVYFRNLERMLPFYDLVYKWWNMDTDDSMFVLYRD